MRPEQSDLGERTALAGARVAMVYDCLYPLTVGGAERWYRALADGLTEAGASITYLTRRQWDSSPPDYGFEVVAVSRAEELYDEQGARRLAPGLRFGAGVFAYLIRHRRSVDVVHIGNFPYWSVLGARLALLGTGTEMVVDWHEIWSARFWRAYAGVLVGTLGFCVQRACITATSIPIVSSEVNRRRLRRAGLAGEMLVLPGYFPADADGALAPTSIGSDGDYVLFAGRHIYDKGIDLLPDVARHLARTMPGLRMVVAGDGPGRADLESAVLAAGLNGTIEFRGFVSDDELRDLMAGALCALVPSRREGYGLILVEAARHGTPVVVAGFEENLAVGNVSEGENGYVADPPTAEALAAAVDKVRRAGPGLRASTLAWFERQAATATMAHSVHAAVDLHERLAEIHRV